MAGHQLAIVHYFQRWSPEGEFAPRAAQVAHDAGAVPIISWEPWQGLDPVADGRLDGYIHAYAAAVAAYGAPLLIRFAHEMNLRGIPWYGRPTTYRAAWTRVRAAFGDAGATNARFVWSPYVRGGGAAAFEPYFPGQDAVDWVALDGYNWGRRQWWPRRSTFERIFGRSLAALERLALGTPIMLAEVGCAEIGVAKARWMRDALLDTIPNRHPRVRAVVWFNQDRPDHADWRIDSSPAALEAWRDIAADERYSLSGAELVAIYG